MLPLTDRQKQVLDYVGNYIDQNGCPPTLREISEHIGTAGTVSAMRHLEALERKGHVIRREGSRGIALAKKPNVSISLPIVGTVRAGQPEPATEDISGYVFVDPTWVKGEGCFFLRVKGDSMVDAHILDGDLALIRPQPNADNGEIIVALIDGEATLKRFYREKGHIRLQPENTSMQPIIIRGKTEAVIAGKLLRTIRTYE